MKSFAFHQYTKILATATFILLAAGGLVTSTGSGLSVPDWPLSYGMLFPPMVGGIRFEHTHRLIAGIVGILTLVLMVWGVKQRAERSVRLLSIFSFVSVLLQAALGGITVIHLLPPSISILHACLGQSFFCLVIALTVITSKEWDEKNKAESENASSIRNLLVITTAFIYIQLIVGAIIRHTKGEGIHYHFILAFLIILHIFFISMRILRDKEAKDRLWTHTVILFFLTLTQITLGFGAFVYKLVLERATQPRPYEVFFATAHQATGALVLALALTLTLKTFHHLKPLPESFVKVEMPFK